MSYANLERADLRKARIVKIQLTGTKLNNCIIDISQMRQIGLKNIFTLMGVAIWGGLSASKKSVPTKLECVAYAPRKIALQKIALRHFTNAANWFEEYFYINGSGHLGGTFALEYKLLRKN